MPEQFGDKQHEATPHRRQKAREEGHVARSQDLSSAVMLLGALAILYVFGPPAVRFIQQLTNGQLSEPGWQSSDADRFAAQTQTLLIELARVLLPVFAALVLLAVAVNVIQTGLLFLPNKLGFDWSRVDPIRGLGRIFSISGAARLGFGVFKLLVVALVAGWAVWSERGSILTLSGQQVDQIMSYLATLTFLTIVKIGIALLVLAILDYSFQRWKHEQDLRMTTQELRAEMKSLQGDPHVAARRKAIQRQLALHRLSHDVSTADATITNPTELAISVRYDLETMDAPVVVAKGAGFLAARIRRLSLENNIPVIERKELARALYKRVEVGQAIPPEHYAAMAEVLRYVYELKGKKITGKRRAS